MKKFAIAMTPLLAAGLLASQPQPAEAALTQKLQNKVADAVRVLDEFMVKRDSEIPTDMIDDAACVAVLPDVTKGALMVGGRYGKGLVSCRLESGGWSAPSFLEIGGASFGLQIGGEITDLVLVVRNREGIDYLLRNKFTLGGDASVAAGPVGRTTSASTDAALQAGILSYSRSRGAFAGLSLDGAVVKQEKSDNKIAYGRRITAREILLPQGASVGTPAALQPFVDALQRHAGR